MNKLTAYLAAFIFQISAGYAFAHSAPLNKVAMEACKEKQKSQACQYEGHHDDLYIGTCQYVSDENMTCVRTKPIRKIDSDEVKSEVHKSK